MQLLKWLKQNASELIWLEHQPSDALSWMGP